MSTNVNFAVKRELYENCSDVDSDIKIELVDCEADSTKCGEVLLGPNIQFTLVCTLCKNNYKDLLEFGNHIKTIHVKLPASGRAEEVLKVEALLDPLRDTSADDNKLLKVEHEERDCGSREELDAFNNDLTTQEESNFEDDNIYLNNFEFELWNNDSDDNSDSKEISPPRPQPKSRHTCVICERSFHKRSLLECHLKNSHMQQKADSKDTDDGLLCKYCDKLFTNLEDFEIHGELHTGAKKYVCAYCPKRFTYPMNRQEHTNTHTGNRPYKCPHCPKAFSQKSNLTAHICIHLNIKNYSCKFCGKKFVKTTEKYIHERTHTGEKPFQCDECGRRFITQVKLTAHTKRHKNIRDFKCTVCGKAFYSQALLKDHMVSHTSDRPFVCKVCGNTFSRRKALRAHAALHSDVKRYVCDVCGKGFAQCAGLYSHKKSHGEKLGKK